VDNDIVRRAPLFTALDDEAATSLMDSMVEVNLGRGEQLFAEGDPGDRLYVIVEGKIKLGRTSSDFATRPGTSEKTRSASTSLVRRRRNASAFSSC
jgi:CRP-like cAMP-binding protein